MESFFGSQEQLVHRTTFPTKAAARQALFDYVEIFYNRRRRHSGVGFLTPGPGLRAHGQGGIATHLTQVSAPAGEAH